jgi:hypothetical protein
MNRHLSRRLTAVAGSLILTACVSAPPQTVELSDVVLEQITYIEKAHRDLVRAYFVQLERDVNGFIDREWIPDFLDRVVRNPQVQQELRSLQLNPDIDAKELEGVLGRSRRFSATESQIILGALAASERNESQRLSEFMSGFSDAAMKEINDVRAQWRQRLRDSESELMSELDESYGMLRAGHMQIRSYLASVVDVRILQDRVAEKIGVLEARDRSMDAILDASDALVDGRERIEELIDIINDIRPETKTPPVIDGPVLDRVLDDILPDGVEPDPLSDEQLNQTLRDLEQSE